MALGGGSPAGRETQQQLPCRQEEPSSPTPTSPLAERLWLCQKRETRKARLGVAGKEAAS